MVVNLFIAVVLNNLEQVRDEHRAEDAEALADSVAAEGAEIPARPLARPGRRPRVPDQRGRPLTSSCSAGSRNSAATSTPSNGPSGVPAGSDRQGCRSTRRGRGGATDRACRHRPACGGRGRSPRPTVHLQRTMAVEGVRRGRSETAQGTMFVTRELHRRERVRPCGSTARSCSLRSVPANDDFRPRHGHNPTAVASRCNRQPTIAYRAVSVRLRMGGEPLRRARTRRRLRTPRFRRSDRVMHWAARHALRPRGCVRGTTAASPLIPSSVFGHRSGLKTRSPSSSGDRITSFSESDRSLTFPRPETYSTSRTYRSVMWPLPTRSV